MSDKDAWDKFEIIFKSTILGLIPLVITLGANTVAQSIKKGEIIQSSVSSLVEEQETARDIALIALDTAFPIERDWRLQRHPDDDEVVKIIEVLLGKTILSPSSAQELESTGNYDVIKSILDRRGGEGFHDTIFSQVIAAKTPVVTSAATGGPVSDQQQATQANISEAISILQGAAEPAASTEIADTCPSGIRLIFIQYGHDNSRRLAQETQEKLSSCGILAPGIEQVSGVQQNDIRYASSVDQQAANGLKNYIEDYVLSPPQDNFFATPIDLSTKGYSSATGQFEIWLK